jgi:hypothetical protein
MGGPSHILLGIDHLRLLGVDFLLGIKNTIMPVTIAIKSSIKVKPLLFFISVRIVL